jgi:hypothetical protein
LEADFEGPGPIGFGPFYLHADMVEGIEWAHAQPGRQATLKDKIFG